MKHLQSLCKGVAAIRVIPPPRLPHGYRHAAMFEEKLHALPWRLVVVLTHLDNNEKLSVDAWRQG